VACPKVLLSLLERHLSSSLCPRRATSCGRTADSARYFQPSGVSAALLWNFQASNVLGFNADIFVASQQIRLYAKDEIFIAVQRDVGAGNAIISVNVIGYLVNTP
jgi:hypothetical protein